MVVHLHQNRIYVEDLSVLYVSCTAARQAVAIWPCMASSDEPPVTGLSSSHCMC